MRWQGSAAGRPAPRVPAHRPLLPEQALAQHVELMAQRGILALRSVVDRASL
jgi:hypothetical protein